MPRRPPYATDVASVAQAEAQLTQAKAQTDSARGHVNNASGHAARQRGCARARRSSVAPFDGMVTNLPVREGETVVVGIQNAEGSTLMTIADMSVVTAEVKVDETDIVNVKIGQPADVTIDAIPGKVFKGHVTLVGDQALLRSSGVATSQSTTGTEEAKDFKVVVTLDQPSDELRPGLSTTAKITTAHKSGVISLPIQALTMHAPETPAQLRAKWKLLSAHARRQARSRTAGRFCRRQGCAWQTARQVRASHHRHYRRHRYRGALRAERRNRGRNRPVQDLARSQRRLSGQTRHRKAGHSNAGQFVAIEKASAGSKSKALPVVELCRSVRTASRDDATARVNRQPDAECRGTYGYGFGQHHH